MTVKPDITAALAHERCPGARASLEARAIVARGHTLAKTNGAVPVVFCVKCGAWSTRRAYGLAGRCRGGAAPAGKQALARIAKGLQPWEDRGGDDGRRTRRRGGRCRSMWSADAAAYIDHAAGSGSGLARVPIAVDPLPPFYVPTAADQERGCDDEVTDSTTNVRSEGGAHIDEADGIDLGAEQVMDEGDRDVLSIMDFEPHESDEDVFGHGGRFDQDEDMTEGRADGGSGGDAADGRHRARATLEITGRRGACQRRGGRDTQPAESVQEGQRHGDDGAGNRSQAAVANGGSNQTGDGERGDEGARGGSRQPGGRFDAADRSDGPDGTADTAARDGRPEQKRRKWSRVVAKGASNSAIVARVGPGDAELGCSTGSVAAPLEAAVTDPVAPREEVTVLQIEVHAPQQCGGEVTRPPDGRSAPSDDSKSGVTIPHGRGSYSSLASPVSVGGGRPQEERNSDTPLMKRVRRSAGLRNWDVLGDGNGLSHPQEKVRRREGGDSPAGHPPVARGGTVATEEAELKQPQGGCHGHTTGGARQSGCREDASGRGSGALSSWQTTATGARSAAARATELDEAVDRRESEENVGGSGSGALSSWQAMPPRSAQTAARAPSAEVACEEQLVVTRKRDAHGRGQPPQEQPVPADRGHHRHDGLADDRAFHWRDQGQWLQGPVRERVRGGLGRDAPADDEGSNEGDLHRGGGQCNRGAEGPNGRLICPMTIAPSKSFSVDPEGSDRAESGTPPAVLANHRLLLEPGRGRRRAGHEVVGTDSGAAAADAAGLARAGRPATVGRLMDQGDGTSQKRRRCSGRHQDDEGLGVGAGTGDCGERADVNVHEEVPLWMRPPAWLFLPSQGIVGNRTLAVAHVAAAASLHAEANGGDGATGTADNDRPDHQRLDDDGPGPRGGRRLAIRGREPAPGATGSVQATIRGPSGGPGTRTADSSSADITAQMRLAAKNRHLQRSLDDHAERVEKRRAMEGDAAAKPSAAQRLEALRRRIAERGITTSHSASAREQCEQDQRGGANGGPADERRAGEGVDEVARRNELLKIHLSECMPVQRIHDPACVDRCSDEEAVGRRYVEMAGMQFAAAGVGSASLPTATANAASRVAWHAIGPADAWPPENRR